MTRGGISNSKFRDDSDDTFYLHHIDQHSGSLRVQVLGYGLSKTFQHHFSQANDSNRKILDKKTSGFLTAVTNSQEIVLAWAESGHGIGRHGDSLQASNHVLGNKTWAVRAIQMAEVLNVDLLSPFDNPTLPRGSFQASHVEVKLATHAIMVLFHMTGQYDAGNKSMLSRENLAALRHIKWKGADGADSVRFEVHVSRKSCNRCGAFLERLEALTGVGFDIKCGTRVVPIQYHQQQLLAAEQLGLGRADGAAGSPQDSTTTLRTVEKDGVIHYIPPGKGAERARAPAGLSLHHLSNVDKPLPATPVTEAPDLSSAPDLSRASGSEEEDMLPFPMRSPRPYSMHVS
ncbi:hypothetical protein MY11210_008656 [Beauveria gryllotalpidicola]